MSTEVDEHGTWEVTDTGRILIEPSAAWLAARDALPADTRGVNRATLEAALAQLLEDAAAALAILQAQRDVALVSFTTVGQAQTAVRGIQQAVQEQARIQQEVIRRVVALARLTVGALDSTDNA